MKKLIGLALIIILAIVAYTFLKPCNSLQCTLDKELYATDGELGRYQFEIDGKRYRYWTLSEIIRQNLKFNKELASNSKVKSMLLLRTSQDGGNNQDNSDPNNLDNYESFYDSSCTVSQSSGGDICFCTSINSEVPTENCINANGIGSTGGSASKCEIIEHWVAKALKGFSNDLPDRVNVSSLIKHKDLIITGTSTDGIGHTFDYSQLTDKTGLGTIEISLTIDDVESGNVYLPFSLK